MLVTTLYHLLLDRALPLAIAIFGFGVLIIVHECGHFLFAKLFGVGTPTFSIGMGPAIYQRQIGTTSFRLGALPIGGYVEVEGQDNGSSPEQISPTSFVSKPYWQKLLIMLGGILCNAFLAFLIFAGVFWRGMPTISIHKATITDIISSAPAAEAGIKIDDIIVGINDKLLTDHEQPMDRTAFGKLLSGNPGDTISLTIERDTHRIVKKVTLANHPKDPAKGFLGIVFSATDYSIERATPQSLLAAISSGFYMTINQGAMVVNALTSMVKQRSMEGVGGPVMIISQGLKNAKEGSIYFFLFLAFISINLALLNLLPLGIVDGGRILFITLEAIFRHSIPEAVHVFVNLLSLFLLAFLMIVLTYRDIIGIFFPKN